MKQPFNWRKISIPKSDFDFSLIGGEKESESSTDVAISDYISSLLISLNHKSRVVVGPELIEIEWFKNESESDPITSAIQLLKNGNYNAGVFLLKAVVATNPDDIDALYNLGMALSDLGSTQQAIDYLSKVTKLAPNFTNAIIALGVAYSRKNMLTDAKRTLELAIAQEPNNPFACRNLAGIYLKLDAADLAVPLLEKSVKLNSSDPAAWFGLGQARLLIDNLSGADEAFRKVIELAGRNNIGDAARTELTKIAELQLRKNGLQGYRPDALMYCLAALEIFDKLTDDQLKQILFEIAMAGDRGFDINNPDKKYNFKTIAGNFSGLQAVCYMYVAGQRIIPGKNMGIDLSKEYTQALALFNASSR